MLTLTVNNTAVIKLDKLLETLTIQLKTISSQAYKETISLRRYPEEETGDIGLLYMKVQRLSKGIVR